jgi:hypothetical protein
MRMRGIHASLALVLVLVLASGFASAQDAVAKPGKDDPGTVHVNAIRNPELHSYRAIVAGLEAFDELHALAPGVPQLLFQARTRGGKPLGSAILKGAAGTAGSPATEPLRARLAGDTFSLPLPLDDEARFQVPRSQQAWDADAELVLSRKRAAVRVWPYVRSPGLAANQQRLGDLRLECRVLIAIAKKEAPLHIVLLVNTVLLSSDWCGFLKDKERTWSVNMPAKLAKAVLYDGNRSMDLQVKGQEFQVPLGDTSWSNDAIVELEFAPAAEPTPTESKEATP